MSREIKYKGVFKPHIDYYWGQNTFEWVRGGYWESLFYISNI